MIIFHVSSRISFLEIKLNYADAFIACFERQKEDLQRNENILPN
jgi:hypothetical protein